MKQLMRRLEGLAARLRAAQCEGPQLREVAIAGNVLTFGFVLGLGTWSIFAPLESAAVASGVLEAETSRKTIQHLEGGVIQEILVKDGDRVRAGQSLLRMDSTRTRSRLASLEGQYWDAVAREARLLAERDGRDAIALPPDLQGAAGGGGTLATVIQGHREIFEARRDVLQSQRAVIQERIAQVEKEITGLAAQAAAAAKRAEIARQETSAVSALVDKGLERRPRLLSLQREAAEIDGRQGELASQISRAHQVISEAKATLVKLTNDHQNEVVQSLRETQNQILTLGDAIHATAEQLSRNEVRAPEAGVVTDLRVHTPGGVIAAGAPVLDLVPRQDRLVVMARLRPEDIDVVHEGAEAEITLLPFNPKKVRPLKGKVVTISADRLLDKRTDQPYYSARIAVDESGADASAVSAMAPGMPARVFVHTGRSTVALYALQPLLDSFHTAFRED